MRFPGGVERPPVVESQIWRLPGFPKRLVSKQTGESEPDFVYSVSWVRNTFECNLKDFHLVDSPETTSEKLGADERYDSLVVWNDRSSNLRFGDSLVFQNDLRANKLEKVNQVLFIVSLGNKTRLNEIRRTFILWTLMKQFPKSQVQTKGEIPWWCGTTASRQISDLATPWFSKTTCEQTN